ncbi:MAG TPA: TIGR02391 family protein [Amycolatopsis sp.]|nr:TIGR02391 family protein [Amycolatopsis sp.]
MLSIFGLARLHWNWHRVLVERGMANYSVDYLRRLRDAVEVFADAFDEWMRTQAESDHLTSRGLMPTVWAKDGQDPAVVRRLELKVAEAAGAAARAVAVTGTYMMVAGFGALDPIANWFTMSAPKAMLSPHDIRSTTAGIKGRLSTMIAEAETGSESALPGFAPSQLHPVIWTAAAAHWTTHQYRVAVREAAEALTVHWKTTLGRNDVDDTVFWQQSLAPGTASAEQPKLVWPGNPADKTNKSMRGGLEPLAKALNSLATGLNLTVRNIATHTRDELSEQEGLERLAAYSYLARLLDTCEIDRGEEPAQPASL